MTALEIAWRVYRIATRILLTLLTAAWQLTVLIAIGIVLVGRIGK